MIAVILAAGASRRLGNITDGLPKTMIRFGDKPILQYQMESLLGSDVDKVYIVVGYKKDIIIDYFGNRFADLQLDYIENREYMNTNTIYSLWLAKEYFINNDFIYFNADVLCHPDVPKRVLKSAHSNVMAIEEKDCGEEEVKVICDHNGKILRIGKDINPDKCKGEFIGIAKFSSDLTEDFADCMERIISAGGEKNFFEKAVDKLLDKFDFYIENITGLPVIEIDFPEDLERARLEVYNKIISEYN